MTTMSRASTADRTAPGRLGDPDLELCSDPRSDPRMVAALAPFGLHTAVAPPPVTPASPRDALLEFCVGAETGFEAVFEALMAGLSPVEGVERTTETISGAGGEIVLHVSRPTGARGPLPGVLHIHGGGMVLLRAEGSSYARLRDELAATGAVVVGVEFRNAGGALGSHPFPAGLDDCTSALHWMHTHRADLGISSITVAGESGGANLTLATTLRAKRDGHLDMIDGVYAMVPYISGAYGWGEADRARELPSLVENDGYFISCALMEILKAVYDPDGAHDRDPLCWPYHATVEDLRGLPPHTISVCEVDPLRDEGVAYYRKLLKAGVPVSGRTVLGGCHAADLMFPVAMPDVYAAAVHDLGRFAASR